MEKAGPIGVFDSGYGGLTILKEIKSHLPEYDLLYLGDSARTPYGNRSYQTVYQYTLQAARFLFSQGCHLIIVACNTASAKALRTIQQNDLPKIAPEKRILGVIRPSVEAAGEITKTGSIGILGTKGTVLSMSFPLEINKLFPDIEVFQHACPLWVPIVENNEIDSPGTEYFVRRDIEELLSKSDKIDAIILGCTHYPLLMNVIKKFVPESIRIIPQNKIVALSLKDYLNRHPEIDKNCSKQGSVTYYTTDDTDTFVQYGQIFMNEKIKALLASIG